MSSQRDLSPDRQSGAWDLPGLGAVEVARRADLLWAGGQRRASGPSLHVRELPRPDIPDRYGVRDLYRQASEHDPDNMLARLRGPQSLESSASELQDGARAARRLDALEAYVSVRARNQTIFWAGYRASVLLSKLAQDLQRDADRADGEAPFLDQDALAGLRTIAIRLQRASLGRRALSSDQLQQAIAQVQALDLSGLISRIQRAARTEAKKARRQTQPLWTILHEQRFRHRFEPDRRSRRQLRKALGVSRGFVLGSPDADRFRVAIVDKSVLLEGLSASPLFGATPPPRWLAGLLQRRLLLRAASSGSRHLGQRTAGSTPTSEISSPGRLTGGQGIAVSLRSNEDPDLQVLQAPANRARFEMVLGQICPR